MSIAKNSLAEGHDNWFTWRRWLCCL